MKILCSERPEFEEFALQNGLEIKRHSSDSLHPGFLFRLWPLNLLRKIPLMTFRILGAVTAMTILSVRGLLEDMSARFPGALKVLVNILDIDVKALRGLAEPLRVAITAAWAPHHD